MKKDGGSESTIIIGPSKSVLVYSFENVLFLARFRVFVPKLLYYIIIKASAFFSSLLNRYRALISHHGVRRFDSRSGDCLLKFADCKLRNF